MAIITSERGKLIRQDFLKIGKGALIAGFGAAAFYTLEALPQVDFGTQWGPIIVALLSVLGNFFRKWWTKNKYQK